MSIANLEGPQVEKPDYKVAGVNDIEIIQPISFDAPWPYFGDMGFSPVFSFEDEEVPISFQRLTERIQRARLAGADPTGIFNFCLEDEAGQHHCTGVIYDSKNGCSLYFCLSNEFPGT